MRRDKISQVPSLLTLAKTASEPVIAKLSHALCEALIETQLAEKVYCRDRAENVLQPKLLEIVKKIKPGSHEAKLLGSSEFARVFFEKLSVHFQFIRSQHEYTGMLHWNYYSASIPLKNGDVAEFKNDQVKQAILALEGFRKKTQEVWEGTNDLLNALLATSIFYNLFFFPSENAMDFYLARFDEAMLKAAKEFIKDHQYSIYKGRTNISVDLICTRFAADPSFISGLLDPSKKPHFVYTVFSGDKLDHLKLCWKSADEAQKKELLDVCCKKVGHIFDPALVSAHLKGDKEKIDWLWSLPKNLEEKKYVLEMLIAASRSITTSQLFSKEKQDKRCLDTAIKLAQSDKNHSEELTRFVEEIQINGRESGKLNSSKTSLDM